MEMDADRWLAHFRANREQRTEPNWAASITLPAEVITKLVRSLEQFHLGDGGGPASLIAWNAESFRSSSDGARQLVDLWFDEEKEHSRLLCGAVARFGGRPITGHWSFSAFCWVRRRFGVRFELTVLLVTEIVSTVYYRLLHRHGDDPALRDVPADPAGRDRARRLPPRSTGAAGAWAGVTLRLVVGGTVSLVGAGGGDHVVGQPRPGAEGPRCDAVGVLP